jgi:dTDP-4-amino-4,6-dideoxygalactose transaminase
MTPAVPFVDLAREHAALMDELWAAFDRVVGASSFILGEEVERFEAEFASYCGVRHCVGVSSGTAALTMSLIAAGIGGGDEVIVPANTFIASGLSVVHAGATPVFCDVEEGTGLIDLDSAASVVTARTAAVMPVHLYGQACDMDAIRSFAEAHGLVVFEDAAQAHGAVHRGKRVGSFGTAGAFSFYPSKNLGGLGDAGAICTNDDGLADGARLLRNHGQRRKGEHVAPGFNERLDGLQAATLRVKLPHLEQWNERRRLHASAYREALGGSLRLLEGSKEGSCVYHVFPVRVSDRDGMRAHLARAGIETGVHYSKALHEHQVFRNHGEEKTGLPVAASWAREELSLPMFPGLLESEIEEVAELCAQLVQSG